MKFNDLSIQEKAAVIKLGVGSGLRSLQQIEQFYNSSQSGDNRPMAIRMMDKSNADFAKRMRDPKRMTIRNWENGADIATHKMSWAEDDVSPYIFPVVQRHGNYLKDYSDPRYSYNDAARIAFQSGDYMRTLNSQEAEWLTTNYKDYYPGFKDPLINASIGREYSMPDYRAVAITSSPMYGIEWNPDDDELDYRDIRNRQLYLESAGKETSRSNKGAQGIFQIMPGTAKWYQESTGDIGDIWDPIYNERVRDWTMDRNWESNVVKEGNPSKKTRMKKTLAAYNYGVGNLQNALNRAKRDGVDIINGDAWLDYLPSETRNYVNFIMNGLDASEHKTQEKYQKWLGSGNKHIKDYGGNLFSKGGSIHIKPQNRGKFTSLKKRTGHSATWFKEHGTPAQKKMATFALNAKKWNHKHPDGGSLFEKWRQYMQDNTIDVPMTFRLPEVEVIGNAPKPGDSNYDKYIANTYDAWKRGDIDINTLPWETRNRVRGYSGTLAAQRGMNDAAKVAGITAAVPTAIIAGINSAIYSAPYFVKGMDYAANPLTTLSKGFKLNPNIQYFAQLGDKALDFIGAEAGLVNGGYDLMDGKIGKGLTEVGLSTIPFISSARQMNKAYNMLDNVSLQKYIDKAVKVYDDDYYGVLKTDQLSNTPIEFITKPNNPRFGKFQNMGKNVAGKADKSIETFWLPYPHNSKFKGFIYAGIDNQKMLENYIDKKVDPLDIYHEIRHLYQPNIGTKTGVPLGVYNNNIGYYVANPDHPLYNTSLHLLNKNIKSGSVKGLSNSWAASPRELDAQVAAFKVKNNITKRFVDLDPNNPKKWELLDFISKDFGNVNDVYKIMNEMSEFGYFKNGGLIKPFSYQPIPNVRY